MPASRASILVVDDREDDFRNLADLLQRDARSPYALTWTRNYDQALDTLIGEHFEVVIVGYKRDRSGISPGLDLLNELKARYRDMPIILLAEHSDLPADPEKDLNGAADFLERGKFDQGQLERSIEHALRHAATTRALHRTEQQLELFMRQVPCAICICDARGRLFFQNAQAERNFSPKDLGRWLAPGGRIPEVHVAGDRHWLLSSFPLAGQDGVQLTGIAGTDITAQVRTEAEARRTSRLLSAILDNLSVMAGRVAADGTVLEMRGFGLAEMGLMESQIVGQNLLDYCPPVRPHFEMARRGLPAAFVWEAEHRGRRLWFENYLHADTEHGGVLSLAVNVTARVEAEAERNRQSRLLDDIMKKLPVVVGQLDREGRVVFVQGEGLGRPGFRPADLIGRIFTEVHPGSRDAIDRGLRGEEVNCALQGEAEGSPWYVDCYVGAYEAGGATFFCRDVTERRWLEHCLLTTTEREQRRIGADLHDGLGQKLTGLACLATALREQLRGDHSAAERANIVARMANESIQQARALARGLCPVELENAGLVMALTELASQTELLSGISCRFSSDCEQSPCGHRASVHLYRITQEAITNAVRHGAAQHVEIRIATSDGQGELTIADGGGGFLVDEASAKRSNGLQLMKFRATMVGGTLEVSSTPGGGTRVSCRFPLPKEAGD
jgi:PAS domain-containing protein/two-component sensor histidine kinase